MKTIEVIVVTGRLVACGNQRFHRIGLPASERVPGTRSGFAIERTPEA